MVTQSNLNIQYRKGPGNTVADALSRVYYAEECKKTEYLVSIALLFSRHWLILENLRVGVVSSVVVDCVSPWSFLCFFLCVVRELVYFSVVNFVFFCQFRQFFLPT